MYAAGPTAGEGGLVNLKSNDFGGPGYKGIFFTVGFF